MDWDDCVKAMREMTLYNRLGEAYEMDDVEVLKELGEFDDYYIPGKPHKLPQKCVEILQSWLNVKNSKLHKALK